MNFKKPSSAKKPKIEKFYKKSDLIIYENMQRFSAFGNMYSSEKKTQPKISFGKGTRTKNEKVYQSKQLSKTQFLGKQAPGPKYSPNYKPLIKQLPKWSFGTSKRTDLNNKGKYDYYQLEDIRLDPLKSKKSTFKKSKDFKFRSSKRFFSKNKKENTVPGPIYDIPSTLENKIGRKFGFRRENKNYKLSKNFGTSSNVGPNSYNPNYKVMSKQSKKPIFSFGKNKRKFGGTRNSVKNDTYEDYHAFGKQTRARKRTESRVKFGKAGRGNSSGVFKGDMVGAMTKLRLPHAHY